MKAIKITASNKISAVEFSNNCIDAKSILNGWPEYVIPRFAEKNTIMIVDENGLWKNLAPNKAGSLMYGTQFHGHPIVGDILIIKKGLNYDGEPDYVPLSEKEAETIKEALLKKYSFLSEN